MQDKNSFTLSSYLKEKTIVIFLPQDVLDLLKVWTQQLFFWFAGTYKQLLSDSSFFSNSQNFSQIAIYKK